ncbi:hypothetical protein HK102_004557 [Quaeritorhiza haematococci]|nr:hypothetical protein HK102_004557 [Quaeritorhiza haematococci]
MLSNFQIFPEPKYLQLRRGKSQESEWDFVTNCKRFWTPGCRCGSDEDEKEDLVVENTAADVGGRDDDEDGDHHNKQDKRREGEGGRDGAPCSFKGHGASNSGSGHYRPLKMFLHVLEDVFPSLGIDGDERSCTEWGPKYHSNKHRLHPHDLALAEKFVVEGLGLNADGECTWPDRADHLDLIRERLDVMNTEYCLPWFGNANSRGGQYSPLKTFLHVLEHIFPRLRILALDDADECARKYGSNMHLIHQDDADLAEKFLVAGLFARLAQGSNSEDMPWKDNCFYDLREYIYKANLCLGRWTRDEIYLGNLHDIHSNQTHEKNKDGGGGKGEEDRDGSQGQSSRRDRGLCLVKTFLHLLEHIFPALGIEPLDM